MAAIEGLFSNVLASIDIELDFPLDRLCRRIGVFLPVACAGFLLACQFADPMRCYITTESEPQSRFLDSYCRTAPSFIVSGETNNGTTHDSHDILWAYFRYFPMLLLFQAFVTYVPYILYYALTQSVIFPVLNEAQDMVKITAFDITPGEDSAYQSEVVVSDSGDDGNEVARRKKPIQRLDSKAIPITADEDVVKNLQASLERRLQVRMNIFVMQRLYGIRGQGIHKKYIWCNVVGRMLVILVEIGLLLPLFWSGFPSHVRCDISNTIANSTADPVEYLQPLYCTIPTASYAYVIFILDLVLIVSLPLLSIIHYVFYLVTGFEADVKEAEVFVEGDRKTFYYDFLDTLLSSKTDDIVLLLALLYANVDKYTTHKILLTFANLTK